MFNQLFGKYLIESDIISEEQYEDILAKVEKNTCKAWSYCCFRRYPYKGKS